VRGTVARRLRRLAGIAVTRRPNLPYRRLYPECRHAALLLIGGYLVWAFLGTDAQPSPKRFTLTLPDSVELPSGAGDMLALSPDGQTIVYRASAEEGADDRRH